MRRLYIHKSAERSQSQGAILTGYGIAMVTPDAAVRFLPTRIQTGPPML